MVGYTIGNLVLRRHASGAVKRDFRMYIRRNTSPNENLKYGYSHYNARLQFCLKFELASFMPHIILQNVTSLKMSNYLRQYIAGYTVANI